MPNAEYFAGHFDGEGYLTMYRKQGGWCLEAKVDVSYPLVLDAYKAQFGGYVYASARTVNKNMWKWKLHHQAQLLLFLQTIEPFSLEKRPQLLLGIEWLQRRQTFPQNRVPYDFVLYSNLCASQLQEMKKISYPRP